MLRRLVIAATIAVSLCFAALPAQASAAVTVVAKNLNNPRGLGIGPDGAIYVAEAGRAGRTCIGEGEDQQCFGFTGSITRIAGGTQQRVLRGLLSVGGPDGSFAVGAHDVAVGPGTRPTNASCSPAARTQGTAEGQLHVVMTGIPPEIRVPRRVRAQQGKLLRVDARGCRAVADLARVEIKRNPDGTDVNPNPYSVALAGSTVLVADAGGNTLLSVTRGRGVKVVTVLPPLRVGGRTVHSVPTTIAIGPDGAYYVGELSGDNAPPNSARIWRVVPGQSPVVHASGFNTITGIDFGPDGSLYVAELFKEGFAQLERGNFVGSLTRIAPDGTQTELAAGELNAPAGVAVTAAGEIYVAVNSLFAGRGQVVRVDG